MGQITLPLSLPLLLLCMVSGRGHPPSLGRGKNAIPVEASIISFGSVALLASPCPIRPRFVPTPSPPPSRSSLASLAYLQVLVIPEVQRLISSQVAAGEGATRQQRDLRLQVNYLPYLDEPLVSIDDDSSV